MKKNTTKIFRIAFILPLLFVLASCKHESINEQMAETPGNTYSVAVVLPCGGGLEIHWRQTLNLFTYNLQKALSYDSRSLNLQFEWYDEETADISTLAKNLSERMDIIAVIGGLYSDNAAMLESVLCRTEKPFFTLATTEELVRQYAGKGNLWAMAETDITQCEVLLSKANMYGAKSVSLIAKENDAYGKTFIDWLPFQAKELGLQVTGVFTYEENIESSVREAAATSPDYIICTPSHVNEVKIILESLKDYALEFGTAPRAIFSDIAYGADVLEKLGSLAEGIEGVCISSDPTSGFDVSYETYFGEDSTVGCAHVYDAAMLLAYALYYNELHPEYSLIDALRYIVDGTESTTGSWMPEDMQNVFRMLGKGLHPDIKGASGELDFDKKVYTNVVNTVYCNYTIYQGKYIVLDYNTTDGSNRTDATLAGWNWKAESTQEFSDENINFNYPQLHERWALIVAASSGWINYRHQADALNMYKILRSRGYDDEHIILIMEDDIAYHGNNPNPGTVQVITGGENLYENVLIDYKTSDLEPEDLENILLGKHSEKTPNVISSDEHDNVLIFWSGHGNPSYLQWLEEEKFTAEMAQRLFTFAYNERKYRKMLCLIEACYSGSIGKQCMGIPGILCFTAANETETSKADIWNTDLSVWMSNRFTSTLHECVTNKPNITFRDLYYRMFINTVGSHVMVYNADSYGNLYLEKINEYF